MDIQLHDVEIIDLSAILAEVSQRLTDAHAAYAEGSLRTQHLTDVWRIRNNMITLLATFEDGPGYGSLEPDMCRAMRHLETAASKLLGDLGSTEHDVRYAAA